MSAKKTPPKKAAADKKAKKETEAERAARSAEETKAVARAAKRAGKASFIAAKEKLERDLASAVTSADLARYSAKAALEKAGRAVIDAEYAETKTPRTEAERLRAAYPTTVVVVAARDGKWVYGPEHLEAELRKRPKGDFANAADASQAATRDHDIIINTAPPDRAWYAKKEAERRAWGRSATPTEPSSTAGSETQTTTTTGDDTMAKSAKSKKSAAKPAAAKSTKAKKGAPAAAPKHPLVTPAAATPKKGASSGNGAAKSTGDFAPGAKITWLVKENPRTPGKETHKRFAKYFGAKTVEDYLAKGGTIPDLKADLKRKYLAVAK